MADSCWVVRVLTYYLCTISYVWIQRKRKKLHADDREKRKRRIPHTHTHTHLLLFIVNIIKKLSVLNTKTSDGNENRWRQKKGGTRDTQRTRVRIKLRRHFCDYFSSVVSSQYCRCTCAHCVPHSRSCFEFLGFAAHITFISVQKPHHNCYLLIFFYTKSHHIFQNHAHSILWRCTPCLWHFSTSHTISCSNAFHLAICVKFDDKRNGSTPHVRDSIKTTLSRFRYISLSTRLLLYSSFYVLGKATDRKVNRKLILFSFLFMSFCCCAIHLMRKMNGTKM